jgi:BASS family bile acid:Na+ symporter
MSIETVVKLLLTVTLIEMMVAIGLGVTWAQVTGIARDAALIARAAIANYVVVPLAALSLVLWFDTPQLTAVGFLIAAVCPGAPYAPPFTGLARGNIAVSVGLMVILAGSSAVMAPLLLRVLLPWVAGDGPLRIDTIGMGATLLAIQLLPLAAGVALRELKPALADRLLGPAKRLAMLLNLAVFALVLAVQWAMLAEIPARGYLGMLLLLLATAAAGWVLGGRDQGTRRAITVTTAVHNLGISLVIANDSFPMTEAAVAVLAYAVFQTAAAALLAFLWGKAVASRGVGGAPA